MKKWTFLLGILFLASSIYSQVGINTDNPLGIFHVDPLKNTSKIQDSIINDSDDVIVTDDGKVGIGTATPGTLLEIKTAGISTAPVPGFQLQDGNEGNGNFLTAIDNLGWGIATWKNLVPATVAVVIKDPMGLNIGFNDPNYYSTNTQIMLPPGRWAINLTSLIAGVSNTQTGVWISSSFADDSTIGNGEGKPLSSIKTPDIEGFGVVAGLCWSQYETYMTIMGSIVINNKSTATKTYYYVVGDTNSFGVPVDGIFHFVGSSYWGETNFIAYRIPSDI